MDYYCRRFNFGKPDITFEESKKGTQKWEAVMSVDDSRIGVGKATNKKNSLNSLTLPRPLADILIASPRREFVHDQPASARSQ